MKPSNVSFLLASAALASAGLVSGCNESGGGGIIFVTRDTDTSFGASGEVFVAERWILFQADEFTTGPAGTDLNSDGGVTDGVARLVDMATQTETNLGVAVDAFAILGSAASAQLYLVVDEAQDGKDWSLDGMLDDVVLLTAGASAARDTGFTALSYVSDLHSGSAQPILAWGDRVWFVEQPAVGNELVLGESALAWIDLTAPTTVNRAAHAITAPGTSNDLVEALQAPSLAAIDNGLLFFTMDETVESATIGGAAGVNLNAGVGGVADADLSDLFVLGVLEAGAAAPIARSFGYAVAGDDVPVRALDLPANDFLIAFLVNETAQGASNFNVSSDLDLPVSGWLPGQCTAEDADTTDDVLHFVLYQGFVANSSVNRPKNTGLAGQDRVLALTASGGNFVATLVPEADAGCDLNDDTDSTDLVFRWAPVGGGTAYFTAAAGLLAVEPVAGGVSGATDFDQRFLAVISEADNDADFNGETSGAGFETQNLVAWLDPSAPSPAWVFDHNPTNGGVQAAGSDWMDEREQRDLLLSTFQESVLDQSLNTGGDDDKIDSLATFARFQSALDLDFPGPTVATVPANAGIVIANDFGFFRVDEADDDRDWNGDGDKTDVMLFRTNPQTMQNTNVLAVLSDLPRPAVESGGTIGVAFVSNEAMAGVDFNLDGDTADLVLRWFRIG